jgi:hypothetical protein
MNIFRILWDDPDDPDGNVQHIAEHGLTIEDVEEVLGNPTSEGTSASTGRPCAWGYTLEGHLHHRRLRGNRSGYDSRRDCV